MGFIDFFKGLNDKSSSNAQPEMVYTPSFYVNEQAQQKANLKGQIKLKEGDFKRFRKEVGEPHPFDYRDTEGLYKTLGLITAVVDKYIDYVVGSGFFLKSENEKAKIIMDDFFKQINFDTILRRWLKEAFIKGFGPLEIGGEKITDQPKGVKVLNANHMFVKRDKKGKIVGYTQFMGDERTDSASKENSTPFKPYQISALMLNQVGDDPYGVGIVSPLTRLLNTIIGLEKDMAILMHRKANAPVHVKMGMKPESWKPNGMPVSQGSVSSMGQKLYNMREQTEWVTDALTEISVVDFGSLGDKFQYPLDYFTDKLIMSTQVPEVLLGRGNIPEGLADVQADAFDRRVKSIQAEVEKLIENDIISRVLESQGIKADVEFEWGQPSKADRNERIAQITTLLTNVMLNTKLKIQLEQELAELMGLQDTTLEGGEVEREQEETEEGSAVPLRFNVNIDEHMHEKIDESKEYTIKEWIGFDFTTYLSNIISITQRDEFKALAAQTQTQIKAGLLTSIQIENLRDTLDDGFKKGLSIRELSKNIETNVNPGDRYILNKDGTPKLKSDGDMILSTSSKHRPIAIARTETVRLANLGAQEQYKEAGIEKYSWVSAFSERTCPECEALNGQIYEVGKGPLPPLHSLCRCTTTAVLEKK